MGCEPFQPCAARVNHWNLHHPRSRQCQWKSRTRKSVQNGGERRFSSSATGHRTAPNFWSISDGLCFISEDGRHWRGRASLYEYPIGFPGESTRNAEIFIRFSNHFIATVLRICTQFLPVEALQHPQRCTYLLLHTHTHPEFLDFTEEPENHQGFAA